MLTGDLGGQYIAFYAQFRDSLLQGESLFFTFSKLLGGSMYNYNIQYLISPLNYLYILFPKVLYPQISVFIFAARIGFSALTFSCCIAYIRQRCDHITLCLSCCYALMGYVAAYFQIPDWHFFILFTPILAITVEQFVRERRWGWYTTALIISILHFYYFGYMLCLFVGCFFLYRLYLCEELTKAQKRNRVFSFLGLSLLSVAATAFYLLPCVLGASEDKGGLFRGMWSFETNFEPLYLFSKFSFGSFSLPNIVNGLPVLYCGTLGVVLLALYFQNAHIRKREKPASASLLLFFFVVLWSRSLNLFLHGGSSPNWFPYRYSFLICFFLLFLASAPDNFSFTPRKIAGNITFFFVLAALSYFFNENSPSVLRICLGAAFACVYLFFLVAEDRGSPICRYARLLTIAAVCCELGLNLFVTMRTFEYYSIGEYIDFVNSWSDSLNAVNDDTFFRLEKMEIRNYNDPLMLNYNGCSLFASQMDSTQGFCGRLGYERNTYGRGSTVFADALLSFKYVLSDNDNAVGPQYRATQKTSPHTIYQSDYVLPLCFSSSDAVLKPIKYENPFQYQNELLQALTGSDVSYFEACAFVVEKTASRHTQITVTPATTGYCYAILPLDNGAQADIYVDSDYFGTYNT